MKKMIKRINKWLSNGGSIPAKIVGRVIWAIVADPVLDDKGRYSCVWRESVESQSGAYVYYVLRHAYNSEAVEIDGEILTSIEKGKEGSDEVEALFKAFMQCPELYMKRFEALQRLESLRNALIKLVRANEGTYRQLEAQHGREFAN